MCPQRESIIRTVYKMMQQLLLPNTLANRNVLVHKLSYFYLPLASIPPYCGHIRSAHNSLQCPLLAVSRSNNEVTGCPRRKLDWRPLTFGCRVGSTSYFSNDLLTSSPSPVLVVLPPFTRNMYESWVGIYVYEVSIRCVDVLIYTSLGK